MTKQELLLKLTGTETPNFITAREDSIIESCLQIINESTDQLESCGKQYAKVVMQNAELLEALKKCKVEFQKQADEGRYPERFLAKNGGEGFGFITDLLKQSNTI